MFDETQLVRAIISRPLEKVQKEQENMIHDLSETTQYLVIPSEILHHTDDLGQKNDKWYAVN